jgi:hypothetical protein
MNIPMNQEHLPRLRAKATLPYQHVCHWVTRVPVKARVLLGLLLVAALLMAVHTALTAKDASLHLKLQHSFRDAQVSVWVDGDLAFSGKITGAPKKKFGLIPTDSMRGSLSQIIPIRFGKHSVRVRVEPDGTAMQEDSVSGDFAHNGDRDLFVSARPNSLSLSWQGTGSVSEEASSSFAWFSRYAGSLLLTIAGSIVSALAGYAIRELPKGLGSTSDAAAKAELGPH